jgi:DNA-directed RNA polymerase specialized sigma24 family protein
MGSHATTIERVYCERYVGFRNALASVTGDPDSARDAVQEGFARALRSAHGFRGDGPIEAWLWKICLRAALELRGRSARDVPLGDVDSALAELPRRHWAPGHRLALIVAFDAAGTEVGRKPWDSSTHGVYPCAKEEELDLGLGVTTCP